MRNQRPRRRRGFTLMEVLLVLAILVILGSLVGIAFTRMQRRGYEGGAQLQIDLFKDALRTYHMDFGRYPENLEDLREPPGGADADRWDGPYLDEDIPTDPWGRPYQYEQSQDEFGEPSFIITSLGADGVQSEDDISNRPK